MPTTPAIDNRDEMLADQADVDDPQSDWGRYLLYRDDLPERLAGILEDRDPSDQKQTALNSLPVVRKVRRQASGAVNAPTVTHDAVRGYQTDGVAGVSD
ncbi:radical SAM protein (plasmid) [Halobiforma lacisalsi AJ5]|uniref:Radical SAM domain-containing protein n=1 Tax=Natronobacterium lacisalsi AJ5 TaxID=358396 RepID=M0LVK9_NATLA|nr:hypothetical protein [Halobiforma lacisalsi]APX00223.1 radical SAM protein [Halobiforma lacisalsi AJ5]EMA37607.1 radical SAM domain-containing protein [Halobiforma lacisalsi AJ5]